MVDTDKKKSPAGVWQPQSDETIAAWDLPAWNDDGQIVKSARREAAEKKPEENPEPVVEEVEEVEPPKLPTAEELKAIADQAQQEGYADGFKEGMEKGLHQGEEAGRKHGEERAYAETRAKMDDEKARLQSIADRLFEPTQQQDEQLESLVVDMAVNLARRLLVNELNSQPEKITSVVKRALTELPVGAKNITVELSPADMALLDEHLPESKRNWRATENAELHQGGCIVKTAESLIDYSVDQRLDTYLREIEQSPAISDADEEDNGASVRPEQEDQEPTSD
ncbi:flagellar assembly protein FliH [Teredinibacter turnerae]|uniref:flagellar assembly protein FliH n=1 Tax=Teredinibacter turnerae TaxID=2426 RepID=UPI00041CB31B|nr:flagellar assembly protein FliH [Teredinibacter turnerae]